MEQIHILFQWSVVPLLVAAVLAAGSFLLVEGGSIGKINLWYQQRSSITMYTSPGNLLWNLVLVLDGPTAEGMVNHYLLHE